MATQRQRSTLHYIKPVYHTHFYVKQNIGFPFNFSGPNRNMLINIFILSTSLYLKIKIKILGHRMSRSALIQVSTIPFYSTTRTRTFTFINLVCTTTSIRGTRCFICLPILGSNLMNGHVFERKTWSFLEFISGLNI